MNKFELIDIIEKFAPLELQEKWDCSGWIIENPENLQISKVMLALTVTDDIVKQALKTNCDMIISHHPLFSVPLRFKNIQLYSAHTNADKTFGGTTDNLIEKLEFKISERKDFVRMVCLENPIKIKNLAQKLKIISPNLRYINNFNVETVSKIAFCAGSGMDLFEDTQKFGADCFVTGDVKFHNAVDSDIVIFDIGHFESEIGILNVFEKLIKDKVEVCFANEKTPYLYI